MSDYDNRPMSTGAWFLTLLVLAIPLVNLIMYVIWALGVGNRNRVTYCRASILWTLLIIGVYAIIFSFSGLSLTDLINN